MGKGRRAGGRLGHGRSRVRHPPLPEPKLTLLAVGVLSLFAPHHGRGSDASHAFRERSKINAETPAAPPSVLLVRVVKAYGAQRRETCLLQGARTAVPQHAARSPLPRIGAGSTLCSASWAYHDGVGANEVSGRMTVGLRFGFTLYSHARRTVMQVVNIGAPHEASRPGRSGFRTSPLDAGECSAGRCPPSGRIDFIRLVRDQAVRRCCAASLSGPAGNSTALWDRRAGQEHADRMVAAFHRPTSGDLVDGRIFPVSLHYYRSHLGVVSRHSSSTGLAGNITSPPARLDR